MVRIGPRFLPPDRITRHQSITTANISGSACEICLPHSRWSHTTSTILLSSFPTSRKTIHPPNRPPITFRATDQLIRGTLPMMTLLFVSLSFTDTARHFLMWDDPDWMFGHVDRFLGVAKPGPVR